MIVRDEITKRLEELMKEHPALKELAQNDATVYSWMKAAMSYEDREYVGSAEEILVGIIVRLGADKKKLYDEIIDHSLECLGTAKLKRSQPHA